MCQPLHKVLGTQLWLKHMNPVFTELVVQQIPDSKLCIKIKLILSKGYYQDIHWEPSSGVGVGRRGQGIFKVSMDSGLFHYLQSLMVDLLRSFGTHSSHNRPRCPTNMCLPIVLLPGTHNPSPLTHSSQCHAIFAGSRLTRLGYGLMLLVNKPRSVPQTTPGLCSLHWRPSSLRTQTMSFTHFFISFWG